VGRGWEKRRKKLSWEIWAWVAAFAKQKKIAAQNAEEKGQEPTCRSKTTD